METEDSSGNPKRRSRDGSLQRQANAQLGQNELEGTRDVNENRGETRIRKRSSVRGSKSHKKKVERRDTEVKYEQIQNRITAAFENLDPDGTGKLDCRLFTTIVYALHRVPTRNQMDDMFETVVDDKHSEYFTFDAFVKMMTRVLMTDRYQSSSLKDLKEALRVLDSENKGHLTADELKYYMVESGGDPLTLEEMDDVLKMTVDPEVKAISTVDYAKKLVIDEYTH